MGPFHGISALKHEALVMEFVEGHGRIARKDAISLCGISEDQAKRLLQILVKKGRLSRKVSRGRASHYEKS